MTDYFPTADEDAISEGSYAVRNQWTFNEYLETGTIQTNFDPRSDPLSPAFNQIAGVTSTECLYEKLLTSANSNCRFHTDNHFSPLSYGNYCNNQSVFSSSSSFEHGSGTTGQFAPSELLHPGGGYQCLHDDGSFPCSPPPGNSSGCLGGSEDGYAMQFGGDLNSLSTTENNNLLTQQNFHSTLEDQNRASSVMEFSMQNLVSK